MSKQEARWNAKPLGNICELNPRDEAPTDKNMAISFVPMPAVSEQDGTILAHAARPFSEVANGYTRFRTGDVIFAKITPCMENGKVAIARNLMNDRACGSTEFHVLRPGQEILVEYLWRYLRQASFREEAQMHMTGAVGQSRVPVQFLRDAAIPLPPIPEQRRIVAKLDSVLGKTKAAREEVDRIPKLVQRYKQAVLAAAFRGELTAEWRTANSSLQDVLSAIARVPAPGQSRGGREATDRVIAGVAALSINNPGTVAPPKWAWVPLSRVSRQETGHTPSRSHPEWWGGEVPGIGIKDAAAHHGRIIHETIQRTNEEGLAHSAARLLPTNTVCLSRTASIGYVLMMGRAMATSQDFVTWTCCEEVLSPKFLMYALIAEGEEIRRFGKGSTHTTIYFPEVRAMHICLPPIEEQHEIVSRVETALDAVQKASAQTCAAERLLNRLEEATLAKAFRGELAI